MKDKYIMWSNESKIVIFVSVDNNLVMMIVLVDIIRFNCVVVFNWLRKFCVQFVMIIGDNVWIVMVVKIELGLDECVVEMKFENKFSWIID